MRNRKRTAGVLLLCGLGLMWSLMPAAATGSSSAESSCRVEGGAELAVAAKAAYAKAGSSTPEGFAEFERWIANDRAQVAKRPIDELIAERFPAPLKKNRYDTMAAGFLGVALDHYAHEMVVVVDPTRIDVARLNQELHDAARAEHLRDPEVEQVDVRAQSGCHSADELVAAGKGIDNRDWHPRASKTAYSYFFAPASSTYEFIFAEQDRDVAEALVKRFGAYVTVTFEKEGPALDKYRTNDTQPHWGGARISSSAHTCTSGFAVDTDSAGKAMVTAGHCFGNGAVITSGTSAYGTAQGEYDFPVFDMMLLNGNVNYDDDLFNDPSAGANESSGLDVSGGGDAAVGQSICISGSFTGRVCGLVVNSIDGGVVCHNDALTVCTYGLTRAEKGDGAFSCQAGDSGAPMYQRVSSGTSALIRAMYVGRPSNTIHHICQGERTVNIEDHLDGAAVATSP